MVALFQSIGITFSIVLLVVLTLATMYLGYVVAIGLLLIFAVYGIYKLITILKTPVLPKEGLLDLKHFL